MTQISRKRIPEKVIGVIKKIPYYIAYVDCLVVMAVTFIAGGGSLVVIGVNSLTTVMYFPEISFWQPIGSFVVGLPAWILGFKELHRIWMEDVGE
ncbi:hypothetical protein A3D71_02450 [Candidatus Kaiserbacteria bacterium RIFCSPHIGHO2_02_FULL_55_20]|uniref:Uncharacterized protein n=1 Tax=Candidatus Kaiserbacteria bacterium RIFCSPHIGHO2_02_FULL_55_20 TaxID=1798497 RepID=A0A1F6DY82_9BACT|nr:MAG: hypothetical protein A2680_00035 [Candidatus Kaiserbacteria bacterium RIFCSPHIGHO2_01_FULL_55_37]OGG66389.1 MAG: hypothetical protein A3D71_02450 [Candidatus Kaiserbacteria bacterium RIFCSPHIGHO2_02_FULL_55_20]